MSQPMPEPEARAVVDSLTPEQVEFVYRWIMDRPRTVLDRSSLAIMWREEFIHEAIDKPRALCAVSDDRQWLVVLDALKMFRLFHKDYWGAYTPFIGNGKSSFIEDTGQDAREVLAAFLARGS